MVAGIADRSRMPVGLESWRRYRNMTQRELAERAGLAVTTINELETGKRTPRPATLRRLASALQTEDWNLFNPVDSTFGILPEVTRAIERLGKAASENSLQGSDGGYLADALVNLEESLGANSSELRHSAEEALVLLIPLWLRLRQRETETEQKPMAQQNALMLSSAMLYRIREWEGRGMPPNVAEALLRAEVRAINMGAADPNGGHDALVEQ
jgi:transcriptional regulator with XRE-family HTH domain